MSDCMQDRQPIDGSGSANRKWPGATGRSLQIAAHVDSFRSTPNQIKVQAQTTGETHVALFRPSWKRKPFPIFVSGREECSSGRNDAPGLRVLGAKLRLHQVFWSQNLAFQSQNATMRPDFSSPVSSHGSGQIRATN